MRLLLVIFLVSFIVITSCKNAGSPIILPATDTAAVTRKIISTDTLLNADPALTDSVKTALLVQQQQLCHSIGLWGKWGSIILQISNINTNELQQNLWLQTMLDSVAALSATHTTDTLINTNSIAAIWQLYVMHWTQQTHIQQIRYGEKYLTHTGKKFLSSNYLQYYENNLKVSLGEAYTKIGDYKKSLAILEELWQQAMLGTDNELKAKQTFPVCNTLNKLSQTNTALVKEKAVVNLPNVSKPTRAYVYTVYSQSLLDNGDTATAVAYLFKAIELVKDCNTKTASDAYVQILPTYASLLLSQKKYSEAIKFYKISNDYYQLDGDGHSREVAKNLISISECFLQENILDSAIAYNSKAIDKIMDLKNTPINYDSLKIKIWEENTIMDAFDNRAEILTARYALQKNTPDLIEIINAASIGFSVQWLLLSSYEFSASLDNENDRGRQRSQLAIDACYQLWQQTKDPKWTLTALEMAEKSKAIVLQQTLTRQLSTSDIIHDTLVVSKQILEEQLAILPDTVGLNALLTDSLFKVKSKLTARLNDLQTLLNIKYPNLKTALGKQDTFNVNIVKKRLLHNDAALVEYFIDTSTNYIFCITKNSNVSMEILPRNALFLANNWQKYFTNKNVIANNFNAFCTDAWQLYTQLFPKAVQRVLLAQNIKQIILIPDGQLGFVPFDALLTEPPGKIELPGSAAYLINKFIVTNGYSAQSLLLRNSCSDANEAACFAPVFSQHPRGLAPLQYSRQEAAITAAAIPAAKSYVEQQATLNTFTDALPTLGLIHLATHASAGDSSLPAIEFYDSSLTLNRIYTLPVRANLVVLSACQTGIGKLQTGEGPLSLARGFYYAGARQVITSLWNVDDKSNAVIFKTFYDNDWQGQTSMALQKAKIDYIKNAGDARASPYYWAGMVIFGTDDNDPSALWLWLTAAGITLICSLLIYLIKCKKNRI